MGLNTTTLSGPWFAPAIAVPYDAKDEFVCPADHIDTVTQLLARVSAVLIVGWRGSETAFTGILSRRLAGRLSHEIPVLVVDHVGKVEARKGVQPEVVRTLMPDNGELLTVSTDGFSAFLRSRALDNWLSLYAS